jgi:hypothetical protein
MKAGISALHDPAEIRFGEEHGKCRRPKVPLLQLGAC